MDLKEYSLLFALVFVYCLKKLYRLLQTGLSKSVSIKLDDKSRFLLKELLHSVAENVFNIYFKNNKEYTGSENYKSSSNSEESDCTYHDCISSGSKPANDSLNKLAGVCQLNKQTAQQNACRSYLSKQASDAIKQIDELSDRMSGIVVVQKPLMHHRNKPSKTDSDQPALPHKARRFQRQHESDASLSSTSSRWKSQKTSIPQQWTPSSSESAKYSLSGDASQESSMGSNDDYEVYSWVSGEGPYESSSGSYYIGDDESEGYSKPRLQHRRQVRRSTSTKKTRQRRVDALSLWENAGNKKGGWKKVKDKFSAILPHHLHHRHNQKYTDGYGDDLNSSELHRKAHRKKDTAIRSPFLKVGAIVRKAVEKIENARDSEVVQKPVNAIRGLFKHARRAKKSKLPSRGIGRYGKTKKHSKMNWLKVLQSNKKKPKKLRLGFRKRK